MAFLIWFLGECSHGAAGLKGKGGGDSRGCDFERSRGGHYELVSKGEYEGKAVGELLINNSNKVKQLICF